tara:strand:- start:212 stop:436 length:225 start_codon:yes stop_codon:yes gene_type:complete
MTSVKIREGQNGYYDQCGIKKFALLEEGQELKIVRELPDNKYICELIRPTEACQISGGYHGMLVEAYVQNLEVV